MGFKKMNRYTGNPWDKQLDESADQFRAFVIYRDAEPKISAEKVGESCGKGKGWGEQLCSAKNWVERRDLWAEYQGKLIVEELARGIPKMRKIHADLSTSILLKATKGLQALNEQEMSARDIAILVDTAMKNERLSRGEPTELTEGKTETNINGRLSVAADPFEGLTTEELREYIHARKSE